MRISLLLHPHLLIHLSHATLLNRQFPPSPTPPPTPLKDNPSCQLVAQALAICNSLTPTFAALPATSQAACLCYSSTLWAPSLFDSAVKYCADYASTAAANAYPAISGLQGFCTDVGDVAKDQPASNSAMVTGSGGGGGYNGDGGACGGMQGILKSCANATPGFTALAATDQAKCLCVAPAADFDGQVASCCAVAKTAAPSLFAVATALEGFCASAGTGGGLSSYSFAVPSAAATTTDSGSGSGMGTGTGTGTTTRVDVTITVVPTQAQAKAALTKVTRGGVVGVSFVCAAVVLFLC